MEDKKFAIAPDGVDPNKVPKRTLNTGVQMPAVGIGTFGSDRFTGEDIAEAVKGAISVGYRHIDCARVYGNEHLIGESLKEAMAYKKRRSFYNIKGMEQYAWRRRCFNFIS